MLFKAQNHIHFVIVPHNNMFSVIIKIKYHIVLLGILEADNTDNDTHDIICEISHVKIIIFQPIISDS